MPEFEELRLQVTRRSLVKLRREIEQIGGGSSNIPAYAAILTNCAPRSGRLPLMFAKTGTESGTSETSGD
jgi:hypothetical protein